MKLILALAALLCLALSSQGMAQCPGGFCPGPSMGYSYGSPMGYDSFSYGGSSYSSSYGQPYMGSNCGSPSYSAAPSCGSPSYSYSAAPSCGSPAMTYVSSPVYTSYYTVAPTRVYYYRPAWGFQFGFGW